MTTRSCNTQGCRNETRSLGHAFCDECTAVVVRTGRPPVLPGVRDEFTPEWRRRATAKDLTGAAA